MTHEEIQDRLRKLTDRYVALNGAWLNIVVWLGHWAITSAGSEPRVSASGSTPDEAFERAEAQIAELEAQKTALARTLGIEAA